MSDVNPDPIAKLAKLTPTPTTDPADLLFAAGRASARTHWGWKAAVAALALSNAALGAAVLLRPRNDPAAPTPVVQPPPGPPAPAPPTSTPTPLVEPWSYRALRDADLERAPAPEPLPDAAPREPLTVLSGRRGDID